MQKIKTLVKGIIVVDHHKTSRKNMRYSSFSFFDMDYSGARLAWDYFNYDESTGTSAKVPALFLLLEDYDLWRFKIDFTSRIMMLINDEKMRWADYEDWMGYFAPFLVSADSHPGSPFGEILTANFYGTFLQGSKMLSDLDFELAMVNSQYQTQKVLDLKMAVIELRKEQRNRVSEIGSFLSNKPDIDFVLLWLGENYYDGSQRFSLRSCDDRIDISKLAKLMGGGGHGCSAAFAYQGSKSEVYAKLGNVSQEMVQIPSKLMLPYYKKFKLEIWVDIDDFNKSIPCYNSTFCAVLFSYLSDMMKHFDLWLEEKTITKEGRVFQWDFQKFSEQWNVTEWGAEEGIVYQTSIDLSIDQVFDVTMSIMVEEYTKYLDEMEKKKPQYYEMLARIPVNVFIKHTDDDNNVTNKYGYICSQ